MIDTEPRDDARLAKFWIWFDTAFGAAAFTQKAEAVMMDRVISAEEVQHRLAAAAEDFVLIDTREPAQFKEAHVKGAINIPLDDMIEEPLHVTPHQGKTIALVCNTGTTTAFFGALFLSENGFEDVFNLDQGIQGWIAGGGETESG